jgi:hypothetical protein
MKTSERYEKRIKGEIESYKSIEIVEISLKISFVVKVLFLNYESFAEIITR